MVATDNYYRRRIEEELAAAERSIDPSISQIHREMAQRYRDMLASETNRANGDATMAYAKGGAIAEPGAIFG